MSWKRKLIKNWKQGGSGALLTVALGLSLLLFDFSLGERLVDLSYDLPFRYRPVVLPQEVVLVYMDDDSHSLLRQPYSAPWDRGIHAALLERLTAEKARAASFDIVFSDPNPEHPEGDARFVQAIKANGHVILGADYLPVDSAAGGGMKFYPPLDAFRDVAAGWGLVQVLPDQDLIVRKHFHVSPNPDDNRYSSLAWELAKLAGAEFAKNDAERSRERWMNYYGSPGTVPGVSFHLALETNALCPAGFFSNKVVLIGANLKTYASGQRKDEFRTPYTKGYAFGPAVDVQATQVLNLLRKDWLTRPSTGLEIVLLAMAGAVLGFGLSLFRPLPAVGLALGGCLGVAFVAQWLFDRQRLWFPWMIIVAAQVPLALLWSVVFNSVQLFVQNRLYEQTLHMYLPSKLVRKFSGNKDLLKQGAHKQVLTLLFSDIADFTTLSEGMDPDELARLMNAYFQAAVGSCIHKTDGTVGKFLGDGIFAFWNAPDRQTDHALRACEAGLRLLAFNGQEIGGRKLRTRIGLHTGIVNVGNFGSADRVDYTALGENVNLASRLEGLNKFLGTGCLISGQTKAEIGDRLVTRSLGSFRLKGFESLVEAHELIGWPEQEPETRPWREVFAQALQNYQQRNLEFAELGFRQVLEMRPGDGPAQFYLDQIAQKGSLPLMEDVTSFTVFKEK